MSDFQRARPGRFLRLASGFSGPILAVFLFFVPWAGSGIRAEAKPDVFTLMAEVKRLEAASLWPGFDPVAIPVAIYDYENTYLFGFPGLPKNFHPLPSRNDVLVFDGRHATVFGNRRTRLEDIWVATFLLRTKSPLTGKPYTLAEMAGIVIHEKFHVFQAHSHPDWRPNDAVLLDYPLDTASSLTLRTMEAGALKRSVAAEDDETCAAWARSALNVRRQRLGALASRHSVYERELARFEGLAEYIEYLASGRAPFEDVPAVGFAPKGVREAGYFEGRWMAGVLDRLDSGWKDDMEAGRFRFLEERLEEVLRGGPPARGFTRYEMRSLRETAVAAVRKKGAERKKRLKNFESRLGTCVEFVAGAIPLRLEMFDPLSMEALEQGKMMHGRWIVLKHEDGVVEIVDRPCMTELNDEGRIARLVCPGIARRNPVRLGRGPVSFQLEGIIAYFKSALVTKKGVDRFIVSLR